jgi:DNA replication protein DnaC
LDAQRAEMLSWLREAIPTQRMLELARQNPTAPYRGGVSTFYTQVKLARIREIHQECLDRAAESQMPYPDFLRGLLQERLVAREENQVRRRLKEAGFPFEKTLEDLDFRLRPELNHGVAPAW